MSLNRNEQRVFDYLQEKVEERQYWVAKVQSFAASARDEFATAARLEMALWEYYVERSGVVPAFRDAAAREGLQRTSMRNLAEQCLRLWGPVRERRTKAEPPGGV